MGILDREKVERRCFIVNERNIDQINELARANAEQGDFFCIAKVNRDGKEEIGGWVLGRKKDDVFESKDEYYRSENVKKVLEDAVSELKSRID